MELTQLSASEIAAGVTAQKFSAAEVVEAHLARIEEVNPAVNAVVTVLARGGAGSGGRPGRAGGRRGAGPVRWPACRSR